ncbi:MAG: hypothetical protein K2X76_05090 [Sphingomonas sp.]|nr:hypothetical protein [Sphingomonas sp.]
MPENEPQRDNRDNRSHRKVLQDAGQTAVFRFLKDQGFSIRGSSTVLSWAMRDSIPGEFWKALAEGGFATLEELSAYAEARKLQIGAAA